MASKNIKNLSKKTKLGIGAVVLVLAAWIVGSSYVFDAFQKESLTQVERDAIQKIGKQISSSALQNDFVMFMEESGALVNEQIQPMPYSKGGPLLIGSGSVRLVGQAGTAGPLKLFQMLPYEDYIIRFEGLDMLNIPDMHVYLTKQLNIENWTDMENKIDLGAVRGNVGDHNYNVPTGVAPEDIGSIVIASEEYEVIVATVNLDLHPLDGGLLKAEKEEIVGSWMVEESGDAGFSAIDFNEDGTYASFLNEKPFDEGTWELVDGEVVLTSNIEDMSMTFRSARIEEGMLLLEGKSRLTRLKAVE